MILAFLVGFVPTIDLTWILAFLVGFVPTIYLTRKVLEYLNGSEEKKCQSKKKDPL